jgi:hypothetical protein
MEMFSFAQKKYYFCLANTERSKNVHKYRHESKKMQNKVKTVAISKLMQFLYSVAICSQVFIK